MFTVKRVERERTYTSQVSHKGNGRTGSRDEAQGNQEKLAGNVS